MSLFNSGNDGRPCDNCLVFLFFFILEQPKLVHNYRVEGVRESKSVPSVRKGYGRNNGKKRDKDVAGNNSDYLLGPVTLGGRSEEVP